MIIDGNQELLSNGSKSLENSYVFEMIKAGNITDRILTPITPSVTRNTA